MQGMVIGKEELNVICGRATQSFDDAANQTYCSDHSGNNGSNRGNNVTPVRRKGEFKACPCCRRYIENFEPVSPGSVETSSTIEQLKQQLQQKQKQQLEVQGDDTLPKVNSTDDNMDVDVDEINNSPSTEEYGAWNLQRSMLTSTMGSSLLSLFNTGVENCGGLEDFNTHQEEVFNMAAPPLAQGDQIQHYTITETIVQGWLYKKGSGNDIWGRRWWKPRWVTLAVSR